MGTWIDFKQLREQLNFAAVLAHYKVSIKRRGSQGTASCPMPDHPRDSKSAAFSVSFEKRIFQCFGCGAKGNVLDFVAYMERLNPRNPQEFRQAALIAQERFLGTKSIPKASTHYNVRIVPPIPSSGMKSTTPTESRVVVNEPLDFALKNLDPCLPYLLQRGFTEETIKHFGLGLCTKGTFAGRIAIPLHDQQGLLIGYAGRTIYDEAIDVHNPKYIYPSRRERDERIIEFSKSMFVYNGHALSEPRVHDLIIVQGFPSVWWLWQHGHRDVVALMGSTCSFDQAKIVLNLVTRSGRVWLLTEAGKGGEKCGQNLFNEIGPHRFCKWLKLREGQPTDCDEQELTKLLAWKLTNNFFRAILFGRPFFKINNCGIEAFACRGAEYPIAFPAPFADGTCQADGVRIPRS